VTKPASSAPNEQLLLPSWLATVPQAPENPTDLAGLRSDWGVLVRDGKIAALGPAAQLKAQYPQVKTLDLSGHLLTPGLINLHTHAAMSLLRGIGDDLPLQRWLTERIWPLETKLMSPEFVYDGALLAAHEMLMGGTTMFNDMYFFPESTARAVQALGMRAALGIVTIDFPSPYGTGPADYLRKGLQCRDTYKDDPLLSFTLAGHAPYTVSDDSFREIAGLAAELGLPIQCHLHETAAEITQSLAQYGKRPLQRLVDLGVIGPDFIAVHAVHLLPEEITLLAQLGASVAHCPHSNLKLGSGIAPTAALLKAGVRVGVGTDGSASNNRLDLLAELRTASLLAKGASGDAQAWSAAQALRAVTIDAAGALGMEAVVGSIEVGKSADLVAFALDSSYLQPVYDPISQLIYAAGRECANYVWIAGSPVVIKRQLNSLTAIRALGEVTAHLPMWHNSVGEIVKAG
jgi:5-methylthioadenosine/S-adenosylhomocysteine deaminase